MTDLWVLIAFHVVIGAVVFLDVGVFRCHARPDTVAQAAIWSAVWVLLALAFAGVIWQFWPAWHPDEPGQGRVKAIAFLTGYVVEKAMSVDNLFVFLIIFRYFAVPAPIQHKVLQWGILGAVFLRASLILAGGALLALFYWMNYVFGAFLLYTAYRLSRSDPTQADPSRNVVVRLARRMAGRTTPAESAPLWLVLVVVELTDLLFALDSIPAVFGITHDVFIVYTSNILAVLGLRALYSLLARILDALVYLHLGLAGVLAFVGIKMIVQQAFAPALTSYGVGETEWTVFTLVVIAFILGLAVAASVMRKPRAPNQTRPAAQTDGDCSP